MVSDCAVNMEADIPLTPSAAGARSDLEQACEAVRRGGVAAAAAEAPSTFVRYSRGLERYAYEVNRAAGGGYREVRVAVLVGATGCGKTRTAHELFGDGIYTLDHAGGDVLWWDGYSDQDVVLIDDFYGWAKYHVLLRWLDRYPVRLPVKGAFAHGSFTKVIITSNVIPRNWYSVTKFPNIHALERRIGLQIDFDVVGLEAAQEQLRAFFAPPPARSRSPSPARSEEQGE